jgi:ribosomal protein S18 acetylase RimI-like enzyme
MYRKVPFEWSSGQVLIERDEATHISWITSVADERFVDVVARSLEASPDTSDITAVRSMGATVAARTLLASAPKWQCSHQPDWWRLVCYRGEPVGFVLPVTFDTTTEPDRLEGTIFHTGVIPDYRGQGFGRILLRESVRVLTRGGVQRILCDTDEANAPMIHLFESEGWGRLPIREVPLPLGFAPGESVKD